MLKQILMAVVLMVLCCDGVDAQGKRKKRVTKNAEELKVGDVAPDWKLTGTDGKEYRLSDYKGKQAVVVAWYPKALTGG